MKDRILEFLRAENKSSAQLAEEIGVQPSGISHILSGRNNPSLDFILKMLEKYSFLSTEWLLFGKGNMYKGTRMQSLFDQSFLPEKEDTRTESEEKKQDLAKPVTNQAILAVKDQNTPPLSPLRRIVWFYEDNTFDEFLPR